MMRRRTLSLSLLAVLLTLGVRPAYGQGQAAPPQRPFRGLFGGPSDQGAQRLSLDLALGGGWDENVLSSSVAAVPGAPTTNLPAGPSSTTGFATTTLRYVRPGNRFNLTSQAVSSARYFPAIDKPFSSSHSGGVAMTLTMAERNHLGINQQVSYAPDYSFGVLGTPGNPSSGTAVTPNVASAAQVSGHFSSNTGLSFGRDLTRRLLVALDYGYRRSGTLADSLGLESQSAGGVVTYQLARGLGLRLGYHYSDSNFSAASTQFGNHSVDGGLDFAQGIALGRSTYLSFSTGIATLRQRDETRYQLRGNVALRREIGRTWTASLSYVRDVQFLDILSEPAFTDALSAGLGGLVTQRLQLFVGGGTTTGEVGGFANASSDRFRNDFGSARATVGLARNVGVSVSYTYFRYRYDDNILLPAGLPNKTSRQGVTVTLQVAPVFSWTRR